MMAQVNAGRVRFVGRGEYNNSTQYYVFDLVSYNGNSYYAKVDTTGHLPTDTTYWQLVAEKGNVGPTGPTGNGISSIAKTSTSGLVDTYTITYTNGNTTTFNVSNGNGIDRIEKTATVGNKDTYTIYFTNGSTTTYEVSNGEVTREELEEEVERLSMIYNAFPSIPGEVEEGSINGTAEVPFKEIGLKGNTSQESTTGQQLFNYQDVVNPGAGWSSDIKGWLTCTFNNTGTSINYQNYFTHNLDLQTSTNYLVVLEVKSVTGTGTINVVSSHNTSQISSGDSVTALFSNLSNNTTYVYPFSTKSDFTSVDYGIRTFCQFNAGQQGTIVCRISVVANTSVTPSTFTYEPYTNGPAPNPDYPYPVNVVTGDNEVKVEGKNLFDKNNYSSYDGYISGTGTVSIVSAANNKIVYIPCLPSTQYTISKISSMRFRIGYSIDIPNANVNVYGLLNNDNGTSLTITTGNDAKYLVVYLYNGNLSGEKSLEDIINSLQIEKSSTASEYEEHKEQTYPINLGSMELCKIGDYQDVIKRSSGKNLFDISAITPDTYVNSADGATGTSSVSNLSDYIKVKANQSYYLSYTYGTLLSTSTRGLVYYDENKQFITGISINPITFHTFTPSQDGYIRFAYDKNYQNIMLNEGITALPYEPYGKVWCKYGAIGKVVLDGSETWVKVRDYVFTNKFDNCLYPTNTDVLMDCLCNNFTRVSNQATWNNYDSLISYYTQTGGRTTVFRYNQTKEISDWTTWLSTHNTTVYYVLNTPTITEITDTTLIEQLDNLEKAYSYDTQTNISQTNQDKPFIISYEAILSLKNVLNS